MSGAWRRVAVLCAAAAFAWSCSADGDGRSDPSGASAAKDAPAAAANAGGEADSDALVAVDEMPRPIHTVAPKYPEAARKRGQEGTVFVRAYVETNGVPRRVGVAAGKGVAPDLDQAAVIAVRQWRFEPAKSGKEPVAVWVMIPVKFALK